MLTFIVEKNHPNEAQYFQKSKLSQLFSIIKRLVPIFDSDWSIAVLYQALFMINTAMTASPNGSIYHGATR